jgi:hypothetical protein
MGTPPNNFRSFWERTIPYRVDDFESAGVFWALGEDGLSAALAVPDTPRANKAKETEVHFLVKVRFMTDSNCFYVIKLFFGKMDRGSGMKPDGW